MYTGLTGKVTIGGSKVAYISNWSIEDTSEVIEITQLGQKYKTKLAGLGSWSASADGSIEFSANSGHKALFDAMHQGAKVECEFYLNDNTDVKFKGNGLIESLSVDLSAEDKGNISISISGCCELEYPGAEIEDECNKPE